jgi:hypothetical protein
MILRENPMGKNVFWSMLMIALAIIVGMPPVACSPSLSGESIKEPVILEHAVSDGFVDEPVLELVSVEQFETDSGIVEQKHHEAVTVIDSIHADNVQSDAVNSNELTLPEHPMPQENDESVGDVLPDLTPLEIMSELSSPDLPTHPDPFKTATAWSAYNAGKTDSLLSTGYFGSVFDGRYVYFVPNRQMQFHGIVLRYDTKADFKQASSWSAYDAGMTDGLNTKGYGGAVFDGRYVYFIPFTDDNSRHGRVLRYDTHRDFRQTTSWSAYDAGMTDGLVCRGFVGAVIVGRYIYLSPFGYNPIAHGRVVRYDTQGDFKKAASWSAYDADKTDGLNSIGYYGLASDGRYVYFVPFNDGTNYHGIMLRYDTLSDFKKAASWSAYDASKIDGLDTVGYKWAEFDGRYIYYVPFRKDATNTHGIVLRYDTQGDFKKASSWQAYDAGQVQSLETTGYVGAIFDQRYLYFVPYSQGTNQFHAKMLRYDTQGDFKHADSWSSHEPSHTDGLTTKGYKGAAFDGTYVYFTPYNNGNAFSGIVLRYRPHSP